MIENNIEIDTQQKEIKEISQEICEDNSKNKKKEKNYYIWFYNYTNTCIFYYI